jgi:hypothetical protein
MIADPRHGKVGQDAVVRPELVEAAAALRRDDERVVGLAHALGLAGRARGVEHDRNVVGAPVGKLILEKAGMLAVEFASDLEQAIEARDALVIAHAARIVVIDVLERGDLRLRFEHLVDLLLILDDRVGDLGVLEHVDEFRRGGVLIHRHRDAAERLGRGHRPVQSRSVVADDREMHAAPESLRGEAAGERADLGGDLRPGPGLPYAEILFAGRGTIAALCRVLHEQPRKRHVA